MVLHADISEIKAATLSCGILQLPKLSNSNFRQPLAEKECQAVGKKKSLTSLYDLRGGGEATKDDDQFDSSYDILPSSLRELVEETISSQRKIIVVTGGVLSGIGKGVTASSIGVLLRAMGLRVTALKIDPYLNVDAGTMSPFEHGEVFVLDDGGETDLDLGNYERFLSVSLTKESNLSTGKIYQVSVQRLYVFIPSFWKKKKHELGFLNSNVV